jgi:hypothetical protein
MKTMHVRIYVRPIPGQWEAFCPEFDIMVNGRSASEVTEIAKEAIEWHIEGALALSEPARSQLLGRKAPFATRLSYALRFNAARLWQKVAGARSLMIREIDVPCPA